MMDKKIKVVIADDTTEFGNVCKNVLKDYGVETTLCEKDGFIPRYYVDGPQDKIDRVIQDMQDYTRNLIIEEMHLGALIERAVQQIEEEKVREAASDATDSPDEDEDERFENDLFNEETKELTDKDFEDFEDFEEEWSNAADDFFNSLLEEDD